MKILYIAKHGPHDNQDEDAIAHALRVLGHEVFCIQQKDRGSVIHTIKAYPADFCLFHKWDNLDTMRELSRRMPMFCWFFDLVDLRDLGFGPRSDSRINWMNSITPYCRGLFLTDGDYVDRMQSEGSTKFISLSQGMDERVAGPGYKAYDPIALLFTGTSIHGTVRQDFVLFMRETYKDHFAVVGEHGARNRVHGRELANLFASARIVIGPEGPVTDRYWSNRAYLTCGLGGFLIHAYSAGLLEQYPHLDMYRSREDLTTKISLYLSDSNYRENTIHTNYQHTMRYHLYRHRCETLIETVKGLS